MEIVNAGEHLIDDPVSFEVTGCRPGETVTVEADYEIAGARFSARAEFVADPNGVVAPGRQESVGGGYRGHDPHGLWWCGEAVGPSQAEPFTPVLSSLSAHAAGGRADADLVRRWLDEGVTCTEVSGPGFTGLLFQPAGEGSRPAVIAFGGSGGGLGPAAAWAPALASRGITTLALAFFGSPGLPDDLVEIEVEVVGRAIARLRDLLGDPPTRITVMGQSRGSELALLAGTFFEEVSAVVIFSGSGLVWSALARGGPIDRPAWTFGGRAIPYMVHGGERPAQSSDEPFALTPLYLALLKESKQMNTAQIPVEGIHGPVLAVSGEADAMWPSAALTAIAEERARSHGFPHQFTHLRYPDAGHTAPGVPGTPIFTEVRHPLGGYYAFGGTREAIARARADSWPQVLRFVRGVV